MAAYMRKVVQDDELIATAIKSFNDKVYGNMTFFEDSWLLIRETC